MAYLDNSQVTVDAILTKRGAELLAMGDNFFNITQFALSDDGVDYSLWNLNHTLGNNYYGELIDNMPTLEAIKDESLVMRNKLITLPRNTVRIPVINIGQTTYELQAAGQSVDITPQTINLPGGNSTYGYTAILTDSRVCTLEVASGGSVGAAAPTTPIFLGDAQQQTVTRVGTKFRITAKAQPNADATAQVIFMANQTGGTVTATITVKQETTATLRV